MRLFAIVLVLTLPLMTNFGHAVEADDIVGDALCEQLLNQNLMDEGAAAMVVRVHNRLAGDFKDLERRSNRESIDVVEVFNARHGLPELRPELIPAPRPSNPNEVTSELRLVHMQNLDQFTGLVSRGVTPRDNPAIEMSERTQVLGRLNVLARAVKKWTPNKKSKSGIELIKMYRGPTQIAEFMGSLGPTFQRPLATTIQDPKPSAIEAQADDSDFGFMEMLFGFMPSKLAQKLALKLGYKNEFPRSLKQTLFLLDLIWVIPGSLGVNVIEAITQASQYVNYGLTQVLSNLQATEVQLSPQMAYTALAGGYGLALALVDVKNYYAEQQVGRNSKPSPNSESTPMPLPPTPMGAQYDLVGWTLREVANGTTVLGPQDLLSWGTNYKFARRIRGQITDFNMMFDLLLFVDGDQPVLIVVNREMPH